MNEKLIDTAILLKSEKHARKVYKFLNANGVDCECDYSEKCPYAVIGEGGVFCASEFYHDLGKGVKIRTLKEAKALVKDSEDYYSSIKEGLIAFGKDCTPISVKVPETKLEKSWDSLLPMIKEIVDMPNVSDSKKVVLRDSLIKLDIDYTYDKVVNLLEELKKEKEGGITASKFLEMNGLEDAHLFSANGFIYVSDVMEAYYDLKSMEVVNNREPAKDALTNAFGPEFTKSIFDGIIR